MVLPGYGVTLSLGIGIPIPVLDEEMARAVSVRNHQLKTRLVDYASGRVLGPVSYAELVENRVIHDGRRLPAPAYCSAT